MPDFKKLKEHVDKLKALLDDRQGMITWEEAVRDNWRAIAEMWAPQPAQGRYVVHLSAAEMSLICVSLKVRAVRMDKESSIRGELERLIEKLLKVYNDPYSKGEEAQTTT